MIKVKICGMTNIEDCREAIGFGTDYVGFVFYKKSKRYVSPTSVRIMSEEIESRAVKVGVFVEETDDEIEKIMDFCHLDLCQVYRESGLTRSIVAYRIENALPDLLRPNGLILFDSYSVGFGGSGKPFPFGILNGATFLRRSFVAGGISPANIAEVLRLQPYGVDLVSSLEIHPGKKDPRKVEQFMKKVRGL